MKGVVPIMESNEDGEEMSATLYPEGIYIQLIVQTPSIIRIKIPLEKLLDAWHKQNEEIAH